jgi:membrane-associated phospholipid phosphatase
MFTAAAVVDARYGWKAGMPAYLVAGFVGYSRIRMQKHFPTDVIAGAALGTIMGRSFAQAHSRSSSHAIIPTLGSHLAMIQFVITFK